MLPLAREKNLIVQEVEDGLLIYDQERQRAHSLNRITALVWQQCNGQTTVAEMAVLLRNELGLPADEKLAWLALEQLGKAHLLREGLILPARAAGISRREMLRKAAITAFALPVIKSIVVPPPAVHARGRGSTCPTATACHSQGAGQPCNGSCPAGQTCRGRVSSGCICGDNWQP